MQKKNKRNKKKKNGGGRHRRRTKSSGRGSVGDTDKKSKLRQEGELILEVVKKMAGRSLTVSRKVQEAGLELVSGTDAGGGTNLQGDIAFVLKGQPGMGLTFLPDYQLEAELEITVQIQAYSDENYLKAEGDPVEEILCPARHGLCLSPSNGLLGFFNKVDVTYDSVYLDGLDNTVCGAANLMAKTGSLEASFNPAFLSVGVVTKSSSSSSSLPCFNREFKDLVRGPGNLDRLWPDHPQLDKGFRTHRAAIPRFPFRVFPPWQTQRLAGILSPPPLVGVIPPDTDFRVLLRRETRVPDIMQLLPLNLSSELACAAESKRTTIPQAVRNWRRFAVTSGTGNDNKTYHEVVSATPRFRKIYLVVKRLVLLADPPRPWPPQTFSVYRTFTREMSKASSQVHLLNWDLPMPPATLFIMFLREHEVMGGGGGLGDTPEKLNQLLSTCPDRHFRPVQIAGLKLCDNTEPAADVLVDNFHLEGLHKSYPDRSLIRYMDHLRSQGFLSAGRETERFFDLPRVLPSEDALRNDPGDMAVYPVALDRGARAWPEQTDSNRCPLHLEVTLTAPMEEKDTWYLCCVFEHAGQAVFHGQTKYESYYTRFPWQ